MGRFRALAAGLIMLPAVAVAQPKAPPTAQQMQQAGELVKKAIAKSQAGEHAAAIELYQQAYTIAPVAILLSNIGTEYQTAQKPVEAIKYFCKYIETEPTGGSVGYASAQVKTLQTSLGNPVDDKDVCKTPPPPPPPLTPKPPVASPEPVPGPLNAGTAEFAEPHGDRTLEIAGAGIATVGAVAVAVGIVFTVKSKRLNDYVNGHAASDAWDATFEGVPIADWDSQGKTWNKEAYAFSIAGGVLVLGGAALFIYGHGKTDGGAAQEHASLVPTASPHGGGLVLTGRF